MGLRGPPPTPTAILSRRGSWLAKTRRDEPQVTGRAPRMPSDLPDEAKAEWQRVVPRLDAARVLTPTDRAALVSYVQWWARFVDACGDADTGEMDRASVQVMKWAVQLGLTPAARARVKTVDSGQDTKQEKDKSRFFAQGPKLAV